MYDPPKVITKPVSPPRQEVRQVIDEQQSKIDIEVPHAKEEMNWQKQESLGLKNLSPELLRAIRDRLIYQKVREEHLSKHPELLGLLN